MEEDGTIVMQLRAESDDGFVGHSYFRYEPNHPRYQEILKHLGGLNPGESKLVLPWPDRTADK